MQLKETSHIRSEEIQASGLESRKVGGLIYVRGAALFPISWLHTQEFCEYQIFLEHVRGIKVTPTRSLTEGKQEHQRLYDNFKKVAVPTTFEEMLAESEKVRVISREFKVFDTRHGIYGRIDEVLLTPDGLVVIDDKPGTRAFLSSMQQVRGYCLAFKERARGLDYRSIIGALRERGTNNMYWQEPFTTAVEEGTVGLVNHIRSLITGAKEFGSADNPNKCRSCRFSAKCDRILA